MLFYFLVYYLSFQPKPPPLSQYAAIYDVFATSESLLCLTLTLKMWQIRMGG